MLMATDYDSVLLRAVSALDPDSETARRALYDRARRELLAALRDSDASFAELNAQRSALEAAIQRIDAKISRGDAASPRVLESRRTVADAQRSRPMPPAAKESRPRPPVAPAKQVPDPVAQGPRAGPLERLSASAADKRVRVGLILAVIVLIVGAAGYAFLGSSTNVAGPTRPNPDSVKVAERGPAPLTQVKPPAKAPVADAEGKASDAKLPYIYRRQPVFYRTTESAGTVIIDKPQRFLYFVQPNNVAVRYGIGVGGECMELAGLLHVSRKVEWPDWQAPAEMVKLKPNQPRTMAGGADNPLGARALFMDDTIHSIHGTNAPNTIGSVAPLGCIGLANDEVIDLFNRVPVGAKVVAKN